MRMAAKLNAALVISLAMTLCAGCAQSRLRQSDDFGVSVRQDVAAQVAVPDAQYEGTPAPGSSGARVGLAQKRYQTNSVIPPSQIGASNPGSLSNSGTVSSGGAGTDSSP